MNDISSSALSDGLSFILEESSDDEHILKYVLNNDNDKRTLELDKLEKRRGHHHHRHPEGQEIQKGSLGETAKKHTNASTKIILLKTPFTMRRIFTADFGCGDTFSFAL